MSYTYLCENSTCSPGQEAESLAECSSATPQFVLWRLNPTADASCYKDSATESCHDSQFGTTSPHSTPPLGADGLTLCAEDSLAKTFPPQEKAQALTAHEADYGGTWPEWFAKFDPVSSSWKTRQCSLLAGLDAFSGTWPRWGMVRDGECFPLPTLEHCTSVRGFGYLPTPRRSGQSRAFKAYKREAYRGNLEEWLGEIGFSGWINPSWSESVMMWPIGWTDTKPLETAKFRQWLLSHGAPSQDSNP